MLIKIRTNCDIETESDDKMKITKKKNKKPF